METSFLVLTPESCFPQSFSVGTTLAPMFSCTCVRTPVEFIKGSPSRDFLVYLPYSIQEHAEPSEAESCQKLHQKPNRIPALKTCVMIKAFMIDKSH